MPHLNFLMVVPTTARDKCIKKELYVKKFTKPNKVKFTIEVEYFKHNILIISFYRDGQGKNDNRYQLRFGNTDPLITFQLFKTCLSIYEHINEQKNYALFFHAMNDKGKNEEYNSRYRTYNRFFERFLSDYYSYHHFISDQLNIRGMYHIEFYTTPNDAKEFFESYSEDIKQHLSDIPPL